MPKHKTSIFIFRRDLRLTDNTTLIAASKNSDNIIPLFICTPTQLANNKYKSNASIQFMIDSLYDLESQIINANSKASLWITYSTELDCIKKLCSDFIVSAIYVNTDYTPYSIKRDTQIQKFCDTNSIEFEAHHDLLLLDTTQITTKAGGYYKVFGQFYKKTKDIIIRKPNTFVVKNFLQKPQKYNDWNISDTDTFLLQKKIYHISNDIEIRGGSYNGMNILHNMAKFADYSLNHDILCWKSTKLSAHNKFGTVSVRQVYRYFNDKANLPDLTRQLYWRDFYYYIAFHYGDSLFSYNHLSKQSKLAMDWNDNMAEFKAWCKGRTGFPIVDAGMRQLSKTGYLPNRARLITSHFLVKDLLVNWRLGEQFYSKYLVDIDRCQNIGNWNWSSSYGLDSTPFLRIFNPWNQSHKFDADCCYIKKWIPELRDVPNSHIHNWNKFNNQYNIDYPAPIVDHKNSERRFRLFYKKNFR